MLMKTLPSPVWGLLLVLPLLLLVACNAEPVITIIGADADAPPEQDATDHTDMAEAEADLDIVTDGDDDPFPADRDQDIDDGDTPDNDPHPDADADETPENTETEREWEELTPLGGCCGDGLPPCENGSCSIIGEAHLCTWDNCGRAFIESNCPVGLQCYDPSGQTTNIVGICANYNDIAACIPPGPKTPMCGCCGDGLPPCELGTHCADIDSHSICTRTCGSNYWNPASVGECTDDPGIDDCLGAWRQCPVAADGDADADETPENTEPEQEWEELTPLGGCCGDGLPPCESGSCSAIGEAHLCTNEYCSAIHSIWCRSDECWDYSGQENTLMGQCADYNDIVACIPPGLKTPMCGCCGDGLPPCALGTRCADIDGHSMCTRTCGLSYWYGPAQVGECLEDQHVDDCLGAWRQCPVAADGDADADETPENTEPEQEWEELTPLGGCCGDGLPPCENGRCSAIGEAHLCTNEYCSAIHTIWCRSDECWDYSGQVTNLMGQCADYNDIVACIPPGLKTPMCGCCGDGLPPCALGTRCADIDGHSMCTRTCGLSYWYGPAQVGECLEDQHVDDCLGAWRQCPVAADGDADADETPENTEAEQEWEELIPLGGCCGDGLPPCESGSCSAIGEAHLCITEYCSAFHLISCASQNCYASFSGQENLSTGYCADHDDIAACIPPGPKTPMCGCCGDGLPPCELGTYCADIDGHSFCTHLCGGQNIFSWGPASVGECTDDPGIDDCLGAWQQCPVAADGDDEEGGNGD